MAGNHLSSSDPYHPLQQSTLKDVYLKLILIQGNNILPLVMRRAFLLFPARSALGPAKRKNKKLKTEMTGLKI